MWERTEITVGRITCDECGRLMTAMWEEKNGWFARSTVFHCWHCDADRELIREYNKEGELTSTRTQRYFFG